MKPVEYENYFNNQFTSKNTKHKLWLPFWWSNRAIASHILKKEANHNHSSVSWIKVFGREVWVAPVLRNKRYDGVIDTERELRL